MSFRCQLQSDLPIHPDSSVFVVADEASTCLWKALIIGPKDTPYEVRSKGRKDAAECI